MSQQRPVIQNTQRKMDVSKSSEDHILYYSNYCINCKEFMNILCKTPIYNKFKKINVSEGAVSIPPFIKRVPTIIVPNYNPLVGEDVFKWLEKVSEQRMSSEQSIIPYHPDEMVIRQLNWENVSRLEEQHINNYDFVSVHWYMRM